MGIQALLSVYVTCDSQDPELDCHAMIDSGVNPIRYDTSDAAIHDWLTEKGWLKVGDDQAWCPACRKQLIA